MLICQRLSDQNILTHPRIHAEFSEDKTSPINTYTAQAARLTNSLLSAWFEMWLGCLLADSRSEKLYFWTNVWWCFSFFSSGAQNWKNSI